MINLYPWCKHLFSGSKHCFIFLTSLLLAADLLAQPIIHSFSPASGPVGTTVTIQGTNFSASTSGNIVYFGAARATVLSATASNITVTVPSGATYQPITVTTNRLTSYSSQPFVVTAPAPYGFSLASFAPPENFFSGNHSRFIASGDMDGDGKPDLISLNLIGSTISLFRNTGGTGTLSLAPPINYDAGTLSFAAALGDLNGDGKLDVVIGDYLNGQIIVYKNAGTPGTVALVEKKEFASGLYPIGVDIIDFDGDGKPDVAVVNDNSHTVSVFKNTSTPDSIRFAVKTEFPVGNRPQRLTIGDFDGDGKPDIAVPNTNDNTVSVLRNTSSAGIISFAQKLDWAMGNQPFQISSGDLTGDGLPELVVANKSAGTFSIYKNTSNAGAIAFADKVDISTGPSDLYSALHDLDGDGKVDIVALGGSGLSVFKNHSRVDSMGFAPKFDYATGHSPGALSIGDLTGDGQPDIAYANSTDSAFLVLKNIMRPVPIIQSFSPVSATTDSVIIITGQGLDGATVVNIGGVPAVSYIATSTSITAKIGAGATGDVVVTTPHGTAVLPGFTFLTPAPVIQSFIPESGAIGTTVTVKGKNFRYISANPVVYFGAVKASISNTTDTTFTVVVPAGATYAPITLTVNSLTAYSAKPFQVTFPGTGTGFKAGSFAAPKDVLVGGNPRSIAVADFDGDGKADLFVTNQSSATASVFRNTSTTKNISLTTKQDLPMEVEPFGVAAGDFDGDGKTDLAISNANSGNAGSVSIRRNTSTNGSISFSENSTMAVGDGPFGLAVADLNADGKPDLVVTAGNSGIIAVFKNTTDSVGHISFARQPDIKALQHSDDIALADLDGDGKPELITADFSGGSMSVWRNTNSGGTISFAAPISYMAGTNPVGISAGDFDKDGKIDIAVVNYSSHTVSVFKNTSTAGSISFLEKQDYPTGQFPRAISLGDLDGDGKTDIIVSCNEPSAVSVIRNTSTIGVLSFANRTEYPTGTQPPGVSIADLDGDGKPEIVVANNYSSISILHNRVDKPIISSFTPTSAKRDSTVTIRGESFTGATAVKFGGLPAASFTIDADSIITAKVGTVATGQVQVTTPYGSDTLSGFTYIPPAPVIKSFSPASGTVGTSVRIVGEHFGNTTSLRFGGTQAASFTINADTLITAVVGKGATGDIVVLSKDGNDTLSGFTYIPPAPVIKSFSPASGTVGTSVRIVGEHFGNITSLRFGGTQAASFTINADTLITAIVGKGATGDISVFGKDGSDTLGKFTFTPPVPIVTSFTPTAGPAGTPVTIRGKNFSWTTGVSFGATKAALYNVNTDSTITAIVGDGGTGVVRITSEFGTDSLGTFIFLQPGALTAYPNPAVGSVLLAHQATDSPSQLKLVDMNGRVVKTIDVPQQQAQTRIDLTNVKPGIYRVVWSDGQTSLSQTILVQ